ncbi:MAG TPA: NADH:flavin oxidoreductase/NADH oxidase [Verrucomicrobiae bacterium]|nr:NADH:flavin oxidoreductase/NADH oxidase [Verrucomicrobiae bacterium]
MPHLFEPFTLRGLTLKHRIVVSPMCMYSSRDGFANDWHLVHLGSRACGGAALVFTEATSVEAEGRISPDDLGLWKDEHIEFLRRITTFIKSQSSAPGIQLAHAGRKASTLSPQEGKRGIVSKENGGWMPLAPSPIPFNPGDPSPEELTVEGIQRIVRKFREAAARALAAGFEVVEMHSAHGYLLNEFLSPLANHRKDAYGGSFDNRTRIVREVTAAVREVWPESKPLFLRISATDWKEPEGWTIEQSVELAKMVRGLGVDLIDCSSGGLVPDAKIPAAPGYQIPFAERIRREAGIATGAVGLITTTAQADEIIRAGKADLVLMARGFLRDPYFPLRAAAELGHDIEWPKQYLRAKGK